MVGLGDRQTAVVYGVGSKAANADYCKAFQSQQSYIQRSKE